MEEKTVEGFDMEAAIRDISTNLIDHRRDFAEHRKDSLGAIQKIREIHDGVSEMLYFAKHLDQLPIIAHALTTNATTMIEVKDKLIAPATDKGWIIKIVLALIGLLATVLIAGALIAIASIVRNSDTVVEMPGGGKVYHNGSRLSENEKSPDAPPVKVIVEQDGKPSK